jgi:hypothetical protein
MKWKGSDLGYTKNCVFIDEAALKAAKQKKRKKKHFFLNQLWLLF